MGSWSVWCAQEPYCSQSYYSSSLGEQYVQTTLTLDKVAEHAEMMVACIVLLLLATFGTFDVVGN